MSVKRIMICDVCRKEEDLGVYNPYREKWYIEEIGCHICSKKCFREFITNTIGINKYLTKD